MHHTANRLIFSVTDLSRELEAFRAAGRNVVAIVEIDRALPYEERWRTHTAGTLDAMKAGADVVCQGARRGPMRTARVGRWASTTSSSSRRTTPRSPRSSHDCRTARASAPSKFQGQEAPIVMTSPLLFSPECRKPDQMRLANAFCRFAELADGALTASASHPA